MSSNKKKNYINNNKKLFATASLNGLKISPKKVRVVASMVRRKSVETSLNLLLFQKKLSAKYLNILLKSAASNAFCKGMKSEKLFIYEILVNNGSIRKKLMPRARGKATSIKKRTSNIRIKLKEII
jgi:large subunit ribosomal protein L22